MDASGATRIAFFGLLVFSTLAGITRGHLRTLFVVAAVVTGVMAFVLYQHAHCRGCQHRWRLWRYRMGTWLKDDLESLVR